MSATLCDPKRLASNDKKTRDAAVRALKARLQVGTTEHAEAELEEDSESVQLDPPFSEKELLVLWKGLFYCVWMSDKPAVQHDLCCSLADLILDFRASHGDRMANAMAFLRAFWTTLTREWGGIDRYRADKFYLLIRKFLTASFRLLIREKWDTRALEHHREVLIGKGGPLNVRDSKTPFGILSHVAEIYLDCLTDALTSTPGDALTGAPVLSLLAPIAYALCNAPSKQIYNTVQSHVILPLLVLCDDAIEAPVPHAGAKRRKTSLGQSAKEGRFGGLLDMPLDLPGKSEKSDPADVKLAVLQYLFEEAARPETPDTNRHRLYSLFKEHGTDC